MLSAPQGTSRAPGGKRTFPDLKFSGSAHNLSLMKPSGPQFVKCVCQNCPGHIEFDDTRAGEFVTCPHCGLETRLYRPQTPLPSEGLPVSQSAPRPEPTKAPEHEKSSHEPSKQFYFYKSKDGEKGPYTDGQLRSLWANGRITADTVYRSGDSSEWMLLRDSRILSAGQSTLAQVLTSLWPLGKVRFVGITALAFGIASCLSCWIPRLGLSTILLAVIGLLFAFAGMVMASRNKRTGFLFSISGSILCVVALFIGFTSGRFSRNASSGPQLFGKTLAGQEWSKSLSVTQENVLVVVVKADVGRVWYRDAVDRPQFTGAYLTIGLGVANVSATKKVDFESWRGAEFGLGRGVVTLSDNYGNSYKRIDVTPAPNLLDPARDTASLRPTERFYDPVVFEVPVQNAKWLHLELPAKNFGGRGMLRFEIPGSRIKWPAPGEQ